MPLDNLPRLGLESVDSFNCEHGAVLILFGTPKSHLAISQQVALLQQRGLVSDASLLASRLNDVEYYRFCAYQPAFRISLQNELLITMLLGNHGLHMRSKPISCYLFIQVDQPPNGIPSRSSFCKNRSNKAFSCIKWG